MKLQMFKNCKIDNVKNVSFFSTIEAQNDYYEGLITAGNGFEKDINFNKLGEPFIINYEYGDILEYNYGRFKLSDKWYYFSVEDLEVNTNGKTKIIYQIDAWETSRLQFGVTLGAGVINRSSANLDIVTLEDGMQPAMINRRYLKKFNSINKSVYIVYHNSVNNYTTAFLMQFDYHDRFSIRDGTYVVSFMQEYGLCYPNTPVISDIIGAWLMPYSNHLNTTIWEKCTRTDGGVESNFLYTLKLNNTSVNAFTPDKIQLNMNLLNMETRKTSITDLTGNIIFTPYPRKMYPPNIYLKLALNTSLTSPAFSCWLSNDATYDDADLKLETLFTLPFEPLDVMGDSYQEYFVRQRDSDIQSRKLSYERQLVERIAGAGQGAIGGAIAGGMSGAGGIGAVAGFGLNAISSLGQYVINQHYDPKEQAIIDKRYKNSKDELIFVGSKVESILNQSTDFSIVEEAWDNDSQNRYFGYINTYGYKRDFYSLNCNQYYNVGYMSGDFEIKGNIPNIWKNQINTRFRNGVRVIE